MSGKRRAPQSDEPECIDVEAFHAQKFEATSDDLVVMIDAKEYRKHVREVKKEAERPSSITGAIRHAQVLHGGPSAAKKRKVAHTTQQILNVPRSTRSPSTSSSSATSHLQSAPALKRQLPTLDISDSDDEIVEALLKRQPPAKKPRTTAPPRTATPSGTTVPPPPPPITVPPPTTVSARTATPPRPTASARTSGPSSRTTVPPPRNTAPTRTPAPPPRHPPPPRPPTVPRQQEIIEIFSDGSEAEEDEEDWDPPGWDINDTDRWTPMPKNVERVDALTQNLRTLAISPSRAPSDISSRPAQTHGSWAELTPRQLHSPQFMWERISASRPPHRARPHAHLMQSPSHPTARTWDDEYRPMLRLKNIYKVKQSPGAINNVVQKGKWTLITSGCIGGLPDIDEEERSPYNSSGALITYDTEAKTSEVPVGHVDKAHGEESAPWIKHYALHDAQFDPLRDIFVSSGADKTVRFWTKRMGQAAEDELFGTTPNAIWKATHSLPFTYPPNQICFKPAQPQDEASFLAVASRNIQILSIGDYRSPIKEGTLNLVGKNNGKNNKLEVTGSMVWGTGPTAGCLFASSEPHPLAADDCLYLGTHKSFNVDKSATLVDFGVNEAGDSLCINPSGTIVALTTVTGQSQGKLRLFDVSRQSSRPIFQIDVGKYPSATRRGFDKYEGEVTSSAFSPDDVYLALGRNDNTVHVYDTRFIKHGPMYRLEHLGECKSAGSEKYGVAKVEWVHSRQTRRIALVSGGEDGCVRLWNPLRAIDDDNGQVIAEVNSDIGYFSLGDPYQGENRLVVGDLSGQASFFDLEI